ncbi:MAG: hypothetical protein A4E31_00382 [Methanomassiliicoccales archaeon PtaU1.Bin030]|nr:MAG: hypothetical protein A4E31_00382 [Methanomassiliicoccales archaeon PtaU1.Bin030]
MVSTAPERLSRSPSRAVFSRKMLSFFCRSPFISSPMESSIFLRATSSVRERAARATASCLSCWSLDSFSSICFWAATSSSTRFCVSLILASRVSLSERSSEVLPVSSATSACNALSLRDISLGASFSILARASSRPVRQALSSSSPFLMASASCATAMVVWDISACIFSRSERRTASLERISSLWLSNAFSVTDDAPPAPVSSLIRPSSASMSART